MKKFLVLLTCLMLFSAGAWADNTIWIDDFSGVGGESITVDLMIDYQDVVSDGQLDAITVYIEFDSTMLEYVSITEGDLKPANGWVYFDANVPDPNANPAELRIGGMQFSGDGITPGSNGSIAHITFQVTCDSCSAGATSALNFTQLLDDLDSFTPTNATFTYNDPGTPPPPPATPTATPTEEPSATPTEEPTAEPSATPTEEPTAEPSATPTEEPTTEPTATPTEEPTTEPSATPTEGPTVEPSPTPTDTPVEPSATPTEEPTNSPTPMPTDTPTTGPSATPTPTPECIHDGDVNGDGSISPDDALQSFQIYLQIIESPTYQQSCSADCNDDGIVSPGDGLCIWLHYLNGSCDCSDPVSPPTKESIGLQNKLGELSKGELSVGYNLNRTGELTVAISLESPITAFDAFGLKVDFPADELDYVKTDAGELTNDWFMFGADVQDSTLTIGGFDPQYEISAENGGTIAVIHFQVKQNHVVGNYLKNIEVFDLRDDLADFSISFSENSGIKIW